MSTPQLYDRGAVRRRLARATSLTPPPLLAEFTTALLERFDEFQTRSTSCLLLGARHSSVPAAVGSHPGIGRVAALAPGPVRAASAMVAVGDEETLPFADSVFDLILAPVALHSINDLPGTLTQARRTLRPDGLFIASLPAENTLCELREILLEAEEAVSGGAALRVPPFADVQTLGNLLPRAGFVEPVADIDRDRLAFADMRDLLRTLAVAGERGGLQTNGGGPLNRAVYAHASALYAARFPHPAGGVTASLDMVTLTARTPSAGPTNPPA